MSKLIRDIKNRKTANDKIYTPLPVAIRMIKMCNITEDLKVLDPCKGNGVFFNNLPKCDKSYCELEENIDFFDCSKTFDLIIGNPPYSLWDKWIEHTMKLSNKFCYILGCFNFTDTRLRKIINNGYGITDIHILKVDWWFSPSFIVVFEKGKKSIITVEDKVVLCDVCNERCKRGRNGNNPNVCSTFKSDF